MQPRVNWRLPSSGSGIIKTDATEYGTKRDNFDLVGQAATLNSNGSPNNNGYNTRQATLGLNRTRDTLVSRSTSSVLRSMSVPELAIKPSTKKSTANSVAKKNTYGIEPTNKTIRSKYQNSSIITSHTINSEKANFKKPKRRHYIFRNVYKKFAFTMLLLISISSLLANLQYYRNNKAIEHLLPQTGAAQASDENVTSSSTDVDETPITEFTKNSYTVAGDNPRYIKINKINVFARVINVGTDKDGAMQTPKNIYDTGWYNKSNLPGTKGAVFINGHVSGPKNRGVFYNIKKLELGDDIIVENGSGKKYTYEVVDKQQVPAGQVNMNKVLTSHNVDKQGLNLMTCGGEFDWKTKTYKDRTIVYSVLK